MAPELEVLVLLMLCRSPATYASEYVSVFESVNNLRCFLGISQHLRCSLEHCRCSWLICELIAMYSVRNLMMGTQTWRSQMLLYKSFYLHI